MPIYCLKKDIKKHLYPLKLSVPQKTARGIQMHSYSINALLNLLAFLQCVNNQLK